MPRPKTSSRLPAICGVLLTSLALVSPTRAAAPVTTWAQSYGVGEYEPDGTPTDPNSVYPSSGYDLATGIAAMPDGGVVICGRLNLPETNVNRSHADGNNGLATLVRYAADGTILWQQALRQSNDVPPPGIPDSQLVATNTVYQVLTDARGNIFTYLDQSDDATGGGDHIVVAKFSPDGALIWQNGFAGDKFADGGTPPTVRPAGPTTGGKVSFDNSFSLTPDGGVILAAAEYDPLGAFTYPFYTKFNADGSLGVHRPFKNISQYPSFRASCQSADGSRILVTSRYSGTVLLTDAASGQILAERTFHSDAGVFNYPEDIIVRVLPLPDNGFLLLGQDVGQYGEGLTLHRVDANLVPISSKVLQNITGTNLAPTSDGGYLLTGVTDAPDGNADVLLLKVDASGNPVFARAIGGPKNEGYNGAQGGQVPGASAVQTTDGGYAFTVSSFSYATGNPGYPDFWTVKTDSNGRLPNFTGVQTDIPLSTFQAHDNTIPSEVTATYDNALPNGYTGDAATVTFGIVLENLGANSGINQPGVMIVAAPVTIIPGTADLGLTETDSPDPVIVGNQLRYLFALTNKGPDTATHIVASFVKSSSMTFVPTASAPGVTISENTLTIPLPDLANGATETYALVFTADAAGIYTVAAGVTADQADPTAADSGLIATTEARLGTAATHAPVITASAGGAFVAGAEVSYVITTDGSVPVDYLTATGLPDGLSVDPTTGAFVGRIAADATLGDYAVTLRATNGAGSSTAARTFTVVAPPTGDAVDLASVLSGLKIQLDGAKQQYKVKGTYTLSNLGDLKGKGIEVGIYLSTSPTLSVPVTVGDPTLLPLPVTLVTTDANGNPLLTPQLALDITKVGQPTQTPIVIKKLKQSGKNGSSIAATFKFKVPAALLDLAAAGNYRYVIVAADPNNKFAEVDETNNVTVVDLNEAVAK